MPKDNSVVIIGTIEGINNVLQCINPGYPRQNLENLEKNDCFYVMNGTPLEIVIRK